MNPPNVLTNEAKSVFLAELRVSGNVSGSARETEYARETFYLHRKQEPDFSDAWDDAIGEASDALEAEARRRAKDGWREPVFYQGQVCGHVERFSDTLLALLLKAHSPKFREKVALEVSGGAKPIEIQITPNVEELEECSEIWQQLKVVNE